MLIDVGRGNQVKSRKSNVDKAVNDCLLSMMLIFFVKGKIWFTRNINLAEYCFPNRKLLT